MPLGSLTELQRAVRAAWSVWTADPVDQPHWSDDAAARGQCGVTALVLQDLIGGELLLADVAHADGRRQGVHYFNRLAGGVEIDLTREQFTRGEIVGEGRVMARAADLTRGRLPGNYRLLSERVRRELTGDADPGRPVTIKAVCALADGRVLLGRNRRGEWELPGGRPQLGELFSDTARREVAEETGLTVTADRVIGLEAMEVLPGAWLDVIGFSCRLGTADGGEATGSDEEPVPVAGDEHTAAAFLDPGRIAAAELPAAYRALIAAHPVSEERAEADGPAVSRADRN